MSTSRLLAGLILGLALVATANAAPKKKLSSTGLDEDNYVTQIAGYISASDTAVACHLRSSDWRKTMLSGIVGTTNMVVNEPTDDEQERHVDTLLRAARIKAALAPHKFEAPTSDECDQLKASKQMSEMDSTASIGEFFNAVQ